MLYNKHVIYTHPFNSFMLYCLLSCSLLRRYSGVRPLALAAAMEVPRDGAAAISWALRSAFAHAWHCACVTDCTGTHSHLSRLAQAHTCLLTSSHYDAKLTVEGVPYNICIVHFLQSTWVRTNLRRNTTAFGKKRRKKIITNNFFSLFRYQTIVQFSSIYEKYTIPYTIIWKQKIKHK